VTVDSTLAQLIARDPEAVAAWMRASQDVWDLAVARFQEAIPRCQTTLAELAADVAQTIAEGLVAEGHVAESLAGPGLDARTREVRLPDLLIVAAVLRREPLAVAYFLKQIHGPVTRMVWRHKGGRDNEEALQQALDDLPGHCFDHPSRGANTARPRLASYSGRAALTTWLVTTTHRLMKDRRRQADSLGAEPAEPTAAGKEDTAKAQYWLDLLIACLHGALDRMPARRRLAATYRWVEGLSPSDVADAMKVSRPRITELLNEARRDFQTAADEVLLRICRETGLTQAQAEQLLEASLEQLLDEASNSGDL